MINCYLNDPPAKFILCSVICVSPYQWRLVTIMDRDKFYRDYSLIHYFLQVTFGDSPVINADIEANITVRMNNGSVVRVNNLTLLDNGYGGECQS